MSKLKPSTAKGYYDFSAGFPETISAAGNRPRTEMRTRLSARKKIIVLIVCILVFVLGFVGVYSCIELSNREPETNFFDVAYEAEIGDGK